MRTLRVYKDKSFIATQVFLKDTFLGRFSGLMLRKSIKSEQGALLKPCRRIHTFMMRFPIDAVFLSDENEILHIEHEMRKNQVSKYVKDASSVLELSAGTALRKGLAVGEKIEIHKNIEI